VVNDPARAVSRALRIEQPENKMAERAKSSSPWIGARPLQLTRFG